MKGRNNNFPVRTESCKQLQNVTGFASVQQGSATVTARATPQLSESDNKSWLQLVSMDSTGSVLCRLHTRCSHRGQGPPWTESSFCGMSSFQQHSQPILSSQSIRWLLFQPSTLGIYPGMSVQSHAYCIAQFLSLRP